MKALLIGLTVIGLAAPALLDVATAQDIDPQCCNMRDKVACTCALQNGGKITRVPVAKKKWWTRGHEARQPDDVPDREKITFPAKFKFKGLKLRPSPQVEGYLACMHRHGRK